MLTLQSTITHQSPVSAVNASQRHTRCLDGFYVLFANTKWKQKSTVKFLEIKYIVAANDFNFGN